VGTAGKIETQIEASLWGQITLSDWLKSNCPDVNSHSRMQSRDVLNWERREIIENNPTLKYIVA
jgi:hypothetical protein